MPEAQIPAPNETPTDDVDSTVFNLYEKREKIYTRKMEGFFQNVRLYTGWPLLLGYFLLPWMRIDGRQAILFDLPERKFHVLWLTFWPQDFVLLGWALMIAAFALFFITTLWGRVWCGYTCPQTVWTAIFMWAEQVTEGDRHQRMRLDRTPWTLLKALKKSAKHSLWLGFSVLTGFTFVAYFAGARELVLDVYHWQLDPVPALWGAFFTATTYINAGWMREQVCIYMCPYARFQAAMFDEDTLIVSYDAQRGEKRGARKRSADPRDLGLGDCIGCNVCVQVCPTGIDIRDGLQYQCIGCARCIDGCDSIMEKMGYERGLIAYTTLNSLEGKPWTWWRPKLIGYGAALAIMVGIITLVLLIRVPLEIDVIRDRGQLFREMPGGLIHNGYTIKILNMDKIDHLYRIGVDGLPAPKLIPSGNIAVPAGEIGEVSLSLQVDPDLLTRVNTRIYFRIETVDGAISAGSESRYLGPRPLEGTVR